MYFAFVLAFVLVASAAGDVKKGICENKLIDCTPAYSSFLSVEQSQKIGDKLRKYTTELVDKSFRFQFMSAAFNRYDQDRPGFKKLYRKISDKAWEDAVDLIKYQSRRGSDSAYLDNKGIEEFKSFEDLVASNELDSLKTALDIEKKMADEAHKIHKHVSHDHHIKQGAEKINYDPDVAHYLDEKIINYQSGVIRDLAGYVQTLHKMTHEKTTQENEKKAFDKKAEDLAVHLFDEYLEKSL